MIPGNRETLQTRIFLYKKRGLTMISYIAKIKDHQSIIYMANDVKDAIEWANILKKEIYGECELKEIWTNGKKVFENKGDEK